MGQGSVTLTNYFNYRQCTTTPTLNEAGNVNDNQLTNKNVDVGLFNNRIIIEHQLNNGANNYQFNISNDDRTGNDHQLNCNYIEHNICTMNVQGLKKFEDDQSFLNFCRKHDIIGMCETWQRNEFDFQSFLEGYINFDCMRPTKGSATRGSGGVTVFVRDYFVNRNIIKRIFDEMSECVVLLLSSELYDDINDIVLIFTYVAPERSPIYTNDNNDGINLLNEKLVDIKVLYPNADIIIAGDLNARTKDFLDYIPHDDLDFVFGDTDYPGDTFNLRRNSKDLQTYNKFGMS